MITDNLNLNNLRIFTAVFKSKSMTVASDELHLTQSGVSQHIKSLEESLEIKLFDRIKHRLIPTEAAEILYKRCTDTFHNIEEALLEIKGREKFLSGKVTIGLPTEFGNNIILPRLAQFAQEHPQVQFLFLYGLATTVSEKLLEGNMDFAFVDAFNLDSRIESEVVYQENLILCASMNYSKLKERIGSEGKKFFMSLEYVDYQQGEPVLKMWFEHHLGSKNLNVNVRAYAMDVQGIAKLILSGLGVGVLPGHLVAQLEAGQQQKLHKFSCVNTPLRNSISIAYLPEKTLSPAAALTKKFLLNTLKN